MFEIKYIQGFEHCRNCTSCTRNLQFVIKDESDQRNNKIAQESIGYDRNHNIDIKYVRLFIMLQFLSPLKIGFIDSHKLLENAEKRFYQDFVLPEIFNNLQGIFSNTVS